MSLVYSTKYVHASRNTQWRRPWRNRQHLQQHHPHTPIIFESLYIIALLVRPVYSNKLCTRISKYAVAPSVARSAAPSAAATFVSHGTNADDAASSVGSVFTTAAMEGAAAYT